MSSSREASPPLSSWRGTAVIPTFIPIPTSPSITDHLVAANQIDELIATSRQAVVVGVGNVALDVARVLIKTADQLDDTDMADEVLASLARQEHH